MKEMINGVLGWINNYTILWAFGASVAFIISLAGKHRLFDRWRYWWARQFNTEQKISKLFVKLQAELNLHFAGQAKLLGVRFSGMPGRMRDVKKPFTPTSQAFLDKVSKIRATTSYPPIGDNFSHALVDPQGKYDETDDEFYIERTDFATICALREEQLPGLILSGGGILFCPAHESVLLQVRSLEVATFLNGVHIFGGNYEPKTRQNLHDDADELQPLRLTATRELAEEAKIPAPTPGKAIVIVSEECAGHRSTGFLQYNYGAISLAPEQLKNCKKSHPEGKVIEVKFEDLPTLLRDGKHANNKDYTFVPSGMLVLIAWLGLGAPDETLARPSLRKAQKIYQAIMQDIEVTLKYNAARSQQLEERAKLERAALLRNYGSQTTDT